MITKSQLQDMLKNKHVTIEVKTDDRSPKLIVHNKPFLYFTVPGVPVPAPRQTQRDKWMKRPCVMRYREYADRLRKFIDLHDMYVGKITMKFYMPMPDSWSLKKRMNRTHSPHRFKPDTDNLIKSVQDALLKNDAMVWCIYAEKRWSDNPRTELTFEATE